MNFTQPDIHDFDYDLPESRIAQSPLPQRDSSRLLVMEQGVISEEPFANIAKALPPESLLVCNNTRVIHARLLFIKESGALIEVFCLEPLAPFKEMNLALQTGPGCEWRCLVGNARKWKEGVLCQMLGENEDSPKLSAIKIAEDNGTFIIRFDWDQPEVPWAEILEQAGKVPLPPYISRTANENDNLRYQTIYATAHGSVAAPTAGLHFTSEVMKSIGAKGIRQAEITLHVGAGTFKPISSDHVAQHLMHTEQFLITRPVLEKLMQHNNKIISVGTTSLRTLESLYWLGVKLINGIKEDPSFSLTQWEPYGNQLPQGIPAKKSWERLLKHLDDFKLENISGQTQLMIIPSYRIRTADLLITNFHQPRSTLLLLVAAFTGGTWKKAYDFALRNNFRFLSYGDACLFGRNSD